jgi:anti-sigma regulatory factor (Ser/Thr protein kinase)
VSGAQAAADGGFNDERTQAWRLPSNELSVRAMRHRLRAVLDASGLPDDELHDLFLAACEAASNAVEHAQNPTVPFVDVVVDVSDGQVTIVIRDHGRWRDGPKSPHRGRGLTMMTLLADTNVSAEPHGTTVTLRSRRPTGGGSHGAVVGEAEPGGERGVDPRQPDPLGGVG